MKRELFLIVLEVSLMLAALIGIAVSVALGDQLFSLAFGITTVQIFRDILRVLLSDHDNNRGDHK